MGWSHGTGLFDAALSIFLRYVPEDQIDTAIEAWYAAFDHYDWDTEDESNYYDMLEPIMRKRGYLDD